MMLGPGPLVPQCARSRLRRRALRACLGLAWVTGSLGACGGETLDLCGSADQKIEECVRDGTSPSPPFVLEGSDCDGRAACLARCVRQASTCEEMQCSYRITDPNVPPVAERPYCECLLKCVEPDLAQ